MLRYMRKTPSGFSARGGLSCGPVQHQHWEGMTATGQDAVTTNVGAQVSRRGQRSRGSSERKVAYQLTAL